MGNGHCAHTDVAHLASIARDICPFPSYDVSPLHRNMLSLNSSLHLRTHYIAVQSSLTPKQLEDFTHSLRTTFGREGKVTLGGVGVVALSLAVLFDTLARKVKGEFIPDSEPIPGLFLKNPEINHIPHIYTISKYLRLVPHIANNPDRMMQETKRYVKQLKTDERTLYSLRETHKIPGRDAIHEINRFLGIVFTEFLMYHFAHINNTYSCQHGDTSYADAIGDTSFNFNCDPEAAEKVFLVEVQKSDNRTREAFENCKPQYESKNWLHHVAKMEHDDVLYMTTSELRKKSFRDLHLSQREDFDLKANALKRWT